jgi:penicillin amidase
MRFLKRLLVGLVVLLVTVALASYFILRGSLPQLDGRMHVEQLHADVLIERDAAGIPSITARNRSDLAYATGFVHGQDRFFQMDLSRRRAAGELAELFGPVAVPLDRQNRLHRFRNRARAISADLTSLDAAVITAYAAGVNAGLESLSTWPFEYLLLRTRPLRWEPEDGLLVVFNMYLELNDERASREERRGLAHRVLPQSLFDFLYPDGTDWDAPLEGNSRPSSPPPQAADLAVLDGAQSAPEGQFAKADEPVVDEPFMVGSNNWAVGGALTDSGRAIVANDMHLGITTPNVFYRARLTVDGDMPRDLNGVTLPGVPLLIAGSNGHIAWGNTNSQGDWTDAAIIRSGDVPGTYLTSQGARKFTTYRETIKVKGGDAEDLLVRETIWGPVLEKQADPDMLLAVSWLAHKPQALNLHGLDLETATSVEQALRIANRIGMPPQNFVVGDAAGNIGWTIAGQIPLRADFDPLLPADWSRSNGWTGWLAADQYPRIMNPDSQRIWTANARVVDDEALSKVGDGGYALGARARQIRDELFARDRFSPADMLPIQLDHRALFLTRWRSLLLETLDAEAVRDNEGRQEYRDLVEDWGAWAAAESVGYRLVRRFRAEVRARVFNMLMRPVREKFGSDTRLRVSNQFEAPLWTLISDQPPHLLSAEYSSWRELLIVAVDANLTYFRENYEDGLSNRTWGERNTASFQHPLSRALPFLARWLDMPRDLLPGDSNMPRAQGPRKGPSERFAVAPGDEANGYFHMPGGQSGHPLSDYYRRGHTDWVEGRATAFLPGKPVHTLTLTPGDSLN